MGGMGWSKKLAQSRLKDGSNKAFRDRHIYLRQTSEALREDAVSQFVDDSSTRTAVADAGVGMDVDGAENGPQSSNATTVGKICLVEFLGAPSWPRRLSKQAL